MKLFLSPHSDDETLFGAYTLLAEKPKVVVCLNGRRARHLPSDRTRERESAAACAILGCEIEFLRVPCDPPDWRTVEDRLREYDPEHVWAPIPEYRGHPDHNALGNLAVGLWPHTSLYATYTIEPDGPVKSRRGMIVNTLHTNHDVKREALACYASQNGKPDTAMHFDDNLDEFLTVASGYTIRGGLRLNLGAGHNPIKGFDNLDAKDGWLFEGGLPLYHDNACEAVTISHALMYVDLADWPFVFSEIARVLEPGGVVRITEDAIAEGDSTRRELRPHAAVATTAALVREHLDNAGLPGRLMSANTSMFHDRSLIQANYGDEPDVFHIEGVKP